MYLVHFSIVNKSLCKIFRLYLKKKRFFCLFVLISEVKGGMDIPLLTFHWEMTSLVIYFLHSLMKSLLRALYLLDLGDTDVSRVNIFSSLTEFRFYPGKDILSNCVHILMIFISLVVHIIQEKNSMFLTMEADID